MTVGRKEEHWQVEVEADSYIGKSNGVAAEIPQMDISLEGNIIVELYDLLNDEDDKSEQLEALLESIEEAEYEHYDESA